MVAAGQEASRDLEARQSRHLDVQEDEVGLGALDRRQRLEAVARLGDDFDIVQVLELVAQLLAGERFVVDNQNLQGDVHLFFVAFDLFVLMR
jgi:hypothetical protein